MHFGATLRLLRLDAGMGLRDMARRLNVSGAYLSRVENGLDSVPTPLRLEAIARALEIPAPLLLNLAHRISPLVTDYVEEIPEAGSLFLEIAHRRLDAPQISVLRAFLNERFPAHEPTLTLDSPAISDLLTPTRVVVGFSGSSIDDVFDIAVGRLTATLGQRAYAIAVDLKRREKEVSSAIGGGVAVPCAYAETEAPAAALVTLAKPLKHDTPDKQKLRLVIMLAGPRSSGERRVRMAQLARLVSRGLCEELMDLESPTQVLSRLALLEGLE